MTQKAEKCLSPDIPADWNVFNFVVICMCVWIFACEYVENRMCICVCMCLYLYICKSMGACGEQDVYMCVRVHMPV